MFTKAQRLEITGKAIAHRLRGKGHTGARLQQAIEEVADDMTTRGLAGGSLVCEETLAEIVDSNLRDWRRVVGVAKRTLAALGG